MCWPAVTTNVLTILPSCLKEDSLSCLRSQLMLVFAIMFNVWLLPSCLKEGSPSFLWSQLLFHLCYHVWRKTKLASIWPVTEHLAKWALESHMAYRLFYEKRHMDHCDFVMGPFKKKIKFNAHRPLLMCKLNSQEFLEAFCLGPTAHKLRLETLRPFFCLSHLVFVKLYHTLFSWSLGCQDCPATIFTVYVWC